MAIAVPEVPRAALVPAPGDDPAAGAILGYTPESWIRLYRRAGPVFRLAETGATVLCGPEANAAAWRTPDDWSYAGSTTGALFVSQLGADYITASDGDSHRRQRKLLRPAITGEALGRHVDTIATELQASFAGLVSAGAVDLHAQLILIYTRAFNRTTVISGADDALVRAIARFEEEMIRGGSLAAPERAAWYARPDYVALRERVLGHFVRVAQTRLAGARADDSLDRIMAALPAGQHGEGLVAELARDAYLLQAGGAGNIASMACHFLAEVWRHPDWHRALVEEIRGTTVASLATQGVRGLPLLAAMLQETERRYAPTPVMPKVAARDLEFLGFSLPQGTEVLHAFGVVNFLPEHYPEPMRFEPARWTGDRTRKPVAFGGGEHMCLGIDLARVCLLLTAWVLLGSFRLEAAGAPCSRRVDAQDPHSPLRLAWDVRLQPLDSAAMLPDRV